MKRYLIRTQIIDEVFGVMLDRTVTACASNPIDGEMQVATAAMHAIRMAGQTGEVTLYRANLPAIIAPATRQACEDIEDCFVGAAMLAAEAEIWIDGEPPAYPHSDFRSISFVELT